MRCDDHCPPWATVRIIGEYRVLIWTVFIRLQSRFWKRSYLHLIGHEKNKIDLSFLPAANVSAEVFSRVARWFNFRPKIEL
jgi:hypothetical protein